MDPVLKAALLSWDWRWDVLLILATAGILYISGWWRLRQKTKQRIGSKSLPRMSAAGWSLAARWRPVSYLSGLLLVMIALLSPIDVLAAQLFTLHMVQHLLLIMIVPPLLLIPNPLPFILWGLPDGLRKKAGRGLSQLISGSSPFRATLRTITTPGITWMFWVISIVGWHDPLAYNAALRSELVHDIEHLMFFLAGMLFWWHVIGAGPRIHKQMGYVGRIAFLLSAIPPNMATGLFLAFAGEPLYAYTTSYLGLSVLADQKLGGFIMWVPGSMMYIVAILIMVGRLLQAEEDKPILPESRWASNENLTAPGLEK